MSTGTPRTIQDEYSDGRIESDSLPPADENLIEGLLPHPEATYQPLPILEAVNDEVERLPPTSEALRSSRVKDAIGADESYYLSFAYDDVFRLYGFWRHPETDYHDRAKYVNPDYAHLGHTGDLLVEGEEQILSEAVSALHLGILSLHDIANRFPMDGEELRTFLRENNINPNRERDYGLERFVCTVITMQDRGIEYQKIAEVFGYEPQRLYDMIAKYRPYQFSPPEPTSDRTAK